MIEAPIETCFQAHQQPVPSLFHSLLPGPPYPYIPVIPWNAKRFHSSLPSHSLFLCLRCSPSDDFALLYRSPTLWLWGRLLKH